MTSVVEVNLAAMEANYDLLRRGANNRLGAVVKANAYGLGAVQVVGRLAQIGCNEYFVANAVEGASLRKEFSDIVIYVLEGALPETLDTLSANNLRPVLNTEKQCALWSKIGKPAALHVDCGMERLGLNLEALSSALGRWSNLDLRLLVSHLARADEALNPFNEIQLERFTYICREVKRYKPEIETSLMNSAGLVRQKFGENLGRAGIGLYGGNPFSDRTNPMNPVVVMKAQVLQKRRVAAGTPVGYGGSYESSADCLLATLGVGYADGIPRLLSNKGRGFVAGKYCPIVGRISMDMLHLNVTGAEVEEGDWVELIGPNVTLDEVAFLADTISYELLTGLGNRSSRLYLS